MNVGITGHQRIGDPSRWAEVKARIEKILSQVERPLIGVTSLAVGSDQVFAEAVLDQGGQIVAVIPFRGYERNFAGEDRDKYQRLLDRAARVEVLPEGGSEAWSYREAGKRVVDLSDLLVAVWDGRDADGEGGTADILPHALEQRKPIVRIDPAELESPSADPADPV